MNYSAALIPFRKKFYFSDIVDVGYCIARVNKRRTLPNDSVAEIKCRYIYFSRVKVNKKMLDELYEKQWKNKDIILVPYSDHTGDIIREFFPHIDRAFDYPIYSDRFDKMEKITLEELKKRDTKKYILDKMFLGDSKKAKQNRKEFFWLLFIFIAIFIALGLIPNFGLRVSLRIVVGMFILSLFVFLHRFYDSEKEESAKKGEIYD